MSKTKRALTDVEAEILGITPRERTQTEINQSRNPRYYVDQEQWDEIVKFREESKYILKSYSKNKNDEITSKKYAVKQSENNIDKSKFIPTSYTTNPFGDGSWTKYELPQQDKLNALQIAVKALKEEIQPTQPIPEPQTTLNKNIINQYTLTDYHLGMMAWGEESGDDWDLKIAEDTLVKFFENAMAKSEDAEECIFAQIGDFLHWDGLDAVTPANKHLLDADTRFTKVVRVAIRVLRRITAMLLTKYKKVNLIMAEGNHDPASSVWLREMFSAFYDHEPRLVIDTNPDPYYCITFGKVCLFYHHAHKKALAQLDNVFVSKFKKEFGMSDFVYGHTGHLHHVKALESNLMILEQHRTLSAKDSYSSRGGYSSGRDAKVITYHREFGEVGRKTININMLK